LLTEHASGDGSTNGSSANGSANRSSLHGSSVNGRSANGWQPEVRAWSKLEQWDLDAREAHAMLRTEPEGA
jgi:hypothetical protein